MVGHETQMLGLVGYAVMVGFSSRNLGVAAERLKAAGNGAMLAGIRVAAEQFSPLLNAAAAARVWACHNRLGALLAVVIGTVAVLNATEALLADHNTVVAALCMFLLVSSEQHASVDGKREADGAEWASMVLAMQPLVRTVLLEVGVKGRKWSLPRAADRPRPWRCRRGNRA